MEIKEGAERAGPVHSNPTRQRILVVPSLLQLELLCPGRAPSGTQLACKQGGDALEDGGKIFREPPCQISTPTLPKPLTESLNLSATIRVSWAPRRSRSEFRTADR